MLWQQLPPYPPEHEGPPAHLSIQRDKAFAIFPYGCVSRFRFLPPRLSQLPVYQILLDKLRSGDIFLDAGCCFGQEIRYLVQAGVSSSQMYGFDLEQKFIELGYERFQDRDKLHAKFVSGDLLAEPGTAKSGGLGTLFEKMDIVFASSLLHFWDWDEMLLAAIRLVSFTRNKTGSMVVGRQMGSLKAGSYSMPEMEGRVYRHDVGSMKSFWDQVGVRTGSRWRVDTELYESEEVKDERSQAWSNPDLRTIWFSAVRD